LHSKRVSQNTGSKKKKVWYMPIISAPGIIGQQDKGLIIWPRKKGGWGRRKKREECGRREKEREREGKTSLIRASDDVQQNLTGKQTVSKYQLPTFFPIPFSYFCARRHFSWPHCYTGQTEALSTSSFLPQIPNLSVHKRFNKLR
jgi:hypothetical protein